MRIVVSGGGTGGHIFPAIAVCEALRRAEPECDLLYIGSIAGMESDIVPKTGVPYRAVTARKLRKVVSLSTIAVALSLVRGYQEARGHIRAFGADALVGTGGYVAASAAFAAASLGVPTVILAPDAIPGRTNRLLARFARRICIVFDETAGRFPAGKTAVTGLPLRSGVVAPLEVTAGAARSAFPQLAPDRFTLLVIGGSQGARALNEVVVEALPEILRAGMQVLHQTGPKNQTAVQEAVRSHGLPEEAAYCPLAFLNEREVPLAYRAADVILCRGGVSTLSEVMANALPAIVVPLPTAYADHQTANAQAMAARGAALCYPEFDLHAEGLLAELAGLRETPGRLAKMSEESRAMSRPGAADDVADIVLRL
jgi:UDP-N-acetylglucosamine--N-acetylmuramyl-(pentapeptide) pyrophosphoryl-undecaprenol N-acetylglucosamine transferase